MHINKYILILNIFYGKIIFGTENLVSVIYLLYFNRMLNMFSTVVYNYVTRSQRD